MLQIAPCKGEHDLHDQAHQHLGENKVKHPRMVEKQTDNFCCFRTVKLKLQNVRTEPGMTWE